MTTVWATDGPRSEQQPATRFIYSPFALLTDFGFTQGPEVPAPRLASLPASRRRPGTVVSAATSLPGTRARAWRLSRSRWEPTARSLSFLPPFATESDGTEQFRGEEWQMS